MATAAQVAANRLNSLKSTGPRSLEGKAVSRFNALKSGIHAQVKVIPGEDAAELETVAANYREQFRPENPAEMFLVDAMIRADWELRRFERIEAKLWESEVLKGVAPAEAFAQNPVFVRVQRRMDTAMRSFYRALQQLQQMRKANQAEEAAEAAEAMPEAVPELASFRENGADRPGGLSHLAGNAPNPANPANP